MGLFSFFKKAGNKILGKAEAEVKKTNPTIPTITPEVLKQQKLVLLKAVVTSTGIPVDNLSLDMPNDETIIVGGAVDKQADKEKVVLALGNVDGIAAVDDRLVVTHPEPEAVFYEVKKGDSLSKIAKAHYGDPMKYPIIFEANKPMLDHPDKIYPGQMLRIPPVA